MVMIMRCPAREADLIHGGSRRGNFRWSGAGTRFAWWPRPGARA